MKLEKFNPFVAARLNAGYRSQDALAQVIGVKRPTYGQWEQGKFAAVYEINLSGFKKMCDVFGWTYEEGLNNLSNLNKWYKDPNIHIVKPTMEQAKAIAKTFKPKLTTLDTSSTDISKETAMLDNPLKVWRGKNNLTRSEAAKLCHVDINVYSDCEDGIKKPNGFDLTKILNGTGLSFKDIQKIFNFQTSNVNGVISVKICDEIDHNKVIEDALEASKKDKEVMETLDKKPEAPKNAYPLNFIVGKCGLPSENWIVEEFNRQMDEKVYASKDASSYIFFKPERDAIRKVFRDGRVADPELLGNVDDAALIFKNHIKKSADLIGTVAEKIIEIEDPDGNVYEDVLKPDPDEPKVIASPMQIKLANQKVSYLKEENVLNNSDRPANNSKNIAISKQTARYILRTLYGVLEYNEYYKILSEFTKGGLNL